jgi:hypothetical protein
MRGRGKLGEVVELRGKESEELSEKRNMGVFS